MRIGGLVSSGVGTKRLKASFTMDASGMRRLEQEQLARISAAAEASVERVTKKAERAVEAATRASIPGKLRPSRLHLAWGSEVIRPDEFKLFGLIRPNGKRSSRSWKTLESYAGGAMIRGRRGQSLAIPTQNAGMRFTGRGKVPLTPAEWERRTYRKLRLVAPRGKPWALLVADDVLHNRKGNARAATSRRQAKYGEAARSLVIFVLVKQVDVPKLLHLPAYVRPFKQEMKAEFLQLFENYQKGGFFNRE